MNPKLVLEISGLAVFLGLALIATCLAGAWNIQRLQTYLAILLTQNVRSLQAPQELETDHADFAGH
jgi:hypothetical protein